MMLSKRKDFFLHLFVLSSWASLTSAFVTAVLVAVQLALVGVCFVLGIGHANSHSDAGKAVQVVFEIWLLFTSFAVLKFVGEDWVGLKSEWRGTDEW